MGNDVNCVMGIVLVVFVVGSFVLGNRGQERYEKPRVRGARVTEGRLYGRRQCLGELDVTSSHDEHIVREMQLPVSSYIRPVERNHRYRVQMPLPTKQTPDRWKTSVWDAGYELDADVVYPQDAFYRDYVQQVADANGYDGPIG